MGNASLEFAIQAIKDEATKPLHLEIERLRAERDALKSQLYNSCEYERHDPEGCTCPLGYRLTEVEAERDAAKAALYESCEDERHNELGWVCPLGHKLNEVEAERDALKQDAERYRCLRDPDCDQWSLPIMFSGDELDREIDRAMPLAGKE